MRNEQFTRPDSTIPRLLFGLLLVLLVWVGVRYSLKAQDNRAAFNRWRPQLLLLQQGVDISARCNYPNPPIMAVLLEPLARLPVGVGAHVWFALAVAMAGMSLWLVRRLVERAAGPFSTWAWLLVVLCCLKPIVDELTHGNVNLFIFFLLVVALTAYSRGRDLTAGVVIGLAIACKLTPALFVPYFVWKRSWKTLLGICLGLVLFLYPGIVPALRLGARHQLQQTASWYGVMVRPYVFDGKVSSEYLNQSLPGVVARLATQQPSLVFWVGNDAVPARFDNLLSLSPAQGQWLVKGCLGLFALAVLCWCRTPARVLEERHRAGFALVAEFGVILLGMLLFSERTWKHHAVTLVLPIAVIVHRLSQTGWRPRLVMGMWLGAMVLLLVCGLSQGGGREVVARTPGLAKVLLIHGGYTWAFVLLLMALLLLLRRPTACRASSPREAVRLTGWMHGQASSLSHVTSSAHARTASP